MALNEKHALITGSSRGIGRGIALALAESQVKVAIHYYQKRLLRTRRSRKSVSAGLMASWCRLT